MKKDFLLFFLILFSGMSSAQVSFSHSAGTHFYLSTSGVISPMFTYSPRINFFEAEKHEMTLSFGTHLGIGFSRRDSSISLNYDIPLVAEINLGQGAHYNTQYPIGLFAGIGVGINKIEVFHETNNAFGLYFNCGLRGNWGGLRFSYIKNFLDIEKGGDVFGLGFFYTINLLY